MSPGLIVPVAGWHRRRIPAPIAVVFASMGGRRSPLAPQLRGKVDDRVHVRRDPAPDWIPFYCLSGHSHGTDRARRGCNAFGRAYARFERIDARYRGRALHEQQGAFDLWRCAGNLVNSLFTIAMSDVADRPEGR